MRLLYSRSIAVTTIVLATSACSSANRSLPPLVSTVPSVSTEEADVAAKVPEDYGILHFRIPVPGRTHDSALHRALPAYVSSATRKVNVTVQGANQTTPRSETFKCTTICEGKIVAPLGVDRVILQLEDKKKRVLSRGAGTVLVFKTGGNTFNFTLDGVPSSVALVPESNVLPVVPASNGYLNFDARDSDGRIITPDGHYTDADGNPLVFEIKSSSTSFHLGVTTVSAPGMPIPFSYAGNLHIGALTLTPSAHKGIKTSVTFKTSTITLAPGIAARLSPPMPVQALGATQVPMPAGSTACSGLPCADPNKVFIFGNAGAQQVVFTFDVTTDGYSLLSGGLAYPGPFLFAPVDLGGNGFSGYYANSPDNASWGIYDVIGFNAAPYGGAFTPCGINYQTPIGSDATDLYCTFLAPPNVYDYTTSSFVANGFPRKIRTLNGTTYFVTADFSPPSQQVYAKGSLTAIAGAYTMGANVTAPTMGYYGDSDGTVKAIAGGTTVATFSHAVENLVGYGSSVYADENGKVFGVSGPSGTFETGPLPISNVVEVVTGVNGTPVLVEADGTLDVMGI